MQKKTTAQPRLGKGEKVGQEPTSGVVTHWLCILEVASSCKLPRGERQSRFHLLDAAAASQMRAAHPRQRVERLRRMVTYVLDK